MNPPGTSRDTPERPLASAGNPDSGAQPSGPETRPDYVGRFAPSPTGSLHLGSLVAAAGSYLDARHHSGRWLLRIEDLDTTRVIPGCADQMLRTLEAFGFEWDGPVEYQSRRTELYEEALDRLRRAGVTFECSCTRRELAHLSEGGYPGTCRDAPQRRGPTATRLRIDDSAIERFDDRVQGYCRIALNTLGDPIIRRRDHAYAYQLAVVVDDAAQHVSDVVRGADLLSCTAWHIALQRELGLPRPRYAHLPLVLEKAGEKLSKSRRSLAIDPAHASAQLCQALNLLQLNPPPELEHATPAALLRWATPRWSLDRFQGWGEIVVPEQKLPL